MLYSHTGYYSTIAVCMSIRSIVRFHTHTYILYIVQGRSEHTFQINSRVANFITENYCK